MLRKSFIESCIDIIAGIVVGVILQWIMFPFFDIHVSLLQNLYITLIFTFVSIIRSTGFRYYFKLRDQKEVQQALNRRVAPKTFYKN
jgi:F0F1-type ATP synthase assembly protein I